MFGKFLLEVYCSHMMFLFFQIRFTKPCCANMHVALSSGRLDLFQTTSHSAQRIHSALKANAGFISSVKLEIIQFQTLCAKWLRQLHNENVNCCPNKLLSELETLQIPFQWTIGCFQYTKCPLQKQVIIANIWQRDHTTRFHQYAYNAMLCPQMEQIRE